VQVPGVVRNPRSGPTAFSSPSPQQRYQMQQPQYQQHLPGAAP
jgi:hypothetical protein